MRSDPVRGIVMLIAAVIAFWKGWHLHGHQAAIAFLLAVLALAMAIWHLTRRPPRPLV